MKYCTSCGEKSGHKICRSCGVKENKEHTYCGWCGASLNENAALCTNCGMKVKPNRFINIVSTIIGIVLLLLTTIFYLRRFNIGSTEVHSAKLFVSMAAMAIAGILCFPFAERLIKSVFAENKVLRQVALLARVAVVVLLVVIGNKSSSGAVVNTQYSVNSTVALEAAVTVFHEKVQLKNEDSFTLNDYKVVVDDRPYKGQDNLHYIMVNLDYSAQNGFGGNNRTDYIVEMYFDTSTNCYYRLDGTLIK